MKKLCTHCDKEKPLKEFYKQALTHHSMCDSCRSAYNRKVYLEKKAKLRQFKW